ncbi:WhiB family transcriptional regulator, redox-sensing transcriptional regulator [Streptomyces sp. MnatMP-M17]|nr:WhiB family transcriptional regulator, redox-sensing transcriptional regulator [Streptomyces sp. MnatMP-M17]
MRCPVRAECAAHALAVREPYGVWGGLTEDEREELMGRARTRLITASASTSAPGTNGADGHDSHDGHPND